jgi:hypothetical protein
MNCQGNVNSTLSTQLPHKFSYIFAILGHNHFESPNIWPLAVFEVHRKFVFLQQMKTVKANFGTFFLKDFSVDDRKNSNF